MESEFYEKHDNFIKCTLCPKNCVIREGHKGFCGVRQNQKGQLIALAYGLPCAMAVDPIEKKPLYHFFPGKKIFSIATVGCNLDCKFCQNSEISKGSPGGEGIVSPKKVIELAKERNCDMIAFTYTEPTIFYEYMVDIAKLARKQGMKTVIVSNGYINPEPLQILAGLIDAANIDLKSMKDKFYKKECSATLAPVLETIKILKKAGVWVEVTNLLIPKKNDSDDEIQDLVKWLHDNEVQVLHYSKFHPYYKMMQVRATPLETLEKAYVISKKIPFVYLGNVISEKVNTYCPECGAKLIDRMGQVEILMEDGTCKCGRKIPGVWS